MPGVTILGISPTRRGRMKRSFSPAYTFRRLSREMVYVCMSAIPQYRCFLLAFAACQIFIKNLHLGSRVR